MKADFDFANRLTPFDRPARGAGRLEDRIRFRGRGVHSLSERFRRTVTNFANGLPDYIAAALVHDGSWILAGHNIVAVQPELAGHYRAGPLSDLSMATAPGHHFWEKKQVLIAEFALNERSKWEKYCGTGYVLRHETGHRLDYAMGNLRNDPAFIEAYNKDVKRFLASPKIDDDNKAYFTMKGGKPRGEYGRSEVVAELWAASRGGGALEDMRNLWPNCTAVLEARLKCLRQAYQEWKKYI